MRILLHLTAACVCLVPASGLFAQSVQRPSVSNAAARWNARHSFVDSAASSPHSRKPLLVGGALGALVGGYVGTLAIGSCESQTCTRANAAATVYGIVIGASVGVAVAAIIQRLPHRRLHVSAVRAPRYLDHPPNER